MTLVSRQNSLIIPNQILMHHVSPFPCQIHEQQKSGYKAEIQSLTHIAHDYLTSSYIPTKIRQGGWIT